MTLMFDKIFVYIVAKLRACNVHIETCELSKSALMDRASSMFIFWNWNRTNQLIHSEMNKMKNCET